MISKSLCTCQISSPSNGLCPDSFCVNLRFIFVVPVKRDVSLLLRQGKMPQTVLIYMQIFLHSPCLLTPHCCQVKWWDPNWASGSKAPLILMLCFQIRFSILLWSEMQWLISVKTAHFSFLFPGNCSYNIPCRDFIIISQL